MRPRKCSISKLPNFVKYFTFRQIHLFNSHCSPGVRPLRTCAFGLGLYWFCSLFPAFPLHRHIGNHDWNHVHKGVYGVNRNKYSLSSEEETNLKTVWGNRSSITLLVLLLIGTKEAAEEESWLKTIFHSAPQGQRGFQKVQIVAISMQLPEGPSW